MTDKEIMTLEKAMFILRHGSAEGEHKYFEAIKVIEEEVNRQQADIKRLISGKCVYLSDEETTEYCVEGLCPVYKTVAQIKSEAIKEFADKVIDFIYDADGVNPVSEWQIRNLVKEMVGE